MTPPRATSGQPPALTDPARVRVFRRRLLAWYSKHARDLPWRRTRDPYRVWVSEVMLQQTQVDTVKPYFERFTRAFPDVRALAAAPEQDVLRAWEGLGYYRRARGLHAAARRIVDDHAGELPSDLATLRTLPGVGRYTAGAIASIAFDQRAPILEANTVRLLARLVAHRGDATTQAGRKPLWELAERLLPRRDVSRFNQALMELGSLVCTPREPNCAQCPVATLCAARADGLVGELGPTTRKLRFTEVREAAVVVRYGERVLVRRCSDGERWAGLWDFPRFEIEAAGPLLARGEIAERVHALTGVRCAPGPLIRTLKHGVTRFRITLDCYRADRSGGRLRSTADRPARWADPETLDELPLCVTGRKIARMLADARAR